MYGLGSGLLEALNVRIIGSGERILLLSHGFGTDQSVWQRILPYFIKDFGIVLFDLMCAGIVNPDNFDLRRYSSLDAYVDDLLIVLDELNIDKCSLSKVIIYPLYLNDVGYEGGFEQEDIDKLLSAMGSNYSAWVSGLAPLAVGADVPAAVREFTKPRQGAMLQSSKDIAVRLAVADYLRTHIGDKSFVDIPQIEGHLPQLSAPAWVIQVLSRVLTRRT
eukprot:Gb_10380 [translate_table: standard]